MNILRQWLRPRPLAARDEGFSLTETIVAMFILAIAALGLLQTLMMALGANRDSRTRMVAANLAAEEIDLAREEGDLFSLLPVTRPAQTVGTDTFHVRRTTGWVSDPNSEFDCGAGGNLRYKRVLIEVSWDNMRNTEQPVRSSTVIDPGNKINDPEKGTILVSVLNGQGTGSEGVTVTATPLFSGGVAPAATTTDAQGCAYLLKVVAGGDYRVTVSKAGYIDAGQQATSTVTVGVEAGASASAGFQYDRAGTFNVAYAGNSTDSSVQAPTNLTSTFVSSYGTYTGAGTGGTAKAKAFSLHPFASGYEVYAGTCLAADPVSWPETGTHQQGARSAPVAAAPGGAVGAPVAMGAVRVDLGSSTNRSLKAVSVPDAAAFPGDTCNTATQTLTFGNALTSGRGTIALPAGKWLLYYGTWGSSTQTTLVASTQIAAVAAPPMTASVATTGGTVTIDPRVAK